MPTCSKNPSSQLSQRDQIIDMRMRRERPEVYEAFLSMIANGQTFAFAEMCATQVSPTTKNSDRLFCEGQNQKMSRMNEWNRNKICQLAQQAGINTHGKYYVGGLGDYTDKHAWVSSVDDMLTVAKKKNYGLNGVINRKRVRTEEDDKPPQRKKLAEDLITEKTEQLLKSDQRLAERVKRDPASVQQVRERVIEDHSPST